MLGARIELAAERSFIGAWHLDNPAVCDDIIRLFQSSPDKAVGAFFDAYGNRIVTAEKESVDLSFAPNSPQPAFRSYIAELQKVVLKYIAEFPWCAKYCGWTVVERVNIQFYPKGGGYKTFHTERASPAMPNASRHLVFMTYLNDVLDAGGTEFLHQKLIVSPRKGLTLIWPSDWTRTHRGIVSPSEEKYIITGWFSFISDKPVVAR